MADTLHENLGAVMNPGGGIAGAGFLVESDVVLTCAHTLGKESGGVGQPAHVRIGSAGRVADSVVIMSGLPQGIDAVLLKLDEPLPASNPVLELELACDLTKEEYLDTRGFPGLPGVQELSGEAKLVGCARAEGNDFCYLQLRSGEVMQGFSGAPLVRRKSGRVVGMVTSIVVGDRFKLPRENFLALPSEVLLRLSDRLHLYSPLHTLFQQLLALNSLQLLRDATRLLTGPVAKLILGHPLKKEKARLLTRASKMPYHRYLDLEILEASRKELFRELQDIRTLLKACRTKQEQDVKATLRIRAGLLTGKLAGYYRLEVSEMGGLLQLGG